MEGGDGELWGEVGVEVGELAPAYVIVSGVVKGGVRSLNGGELIAKAGEGGGGGGKGADVGIAEGHKAEGRVDRGEGVVGGDEGGGVGTVAGPLVVGEAQPPVNITEAEGGGREASAGGR